MSDGDAEATIRWCFPLTEADLTRLSSTTRTRVTWDKATKRLIAAEEVCYGEIVTKSRPLKSIPPALQVEAERCRLRHEGLPWSTSTQRLVERIAFLRRTLPAENYPSLDDEALIEQLAQMPGLSLQTAILNLLTDSGHSQMELDREAPTHFRVPSGSNMTVHYDLDQPYVAVKIQEVFGLKATPRIAKGQVPILLHLLSPAQRPVQVTSDLASFWANGYAIVRKDLRGRYPKHYWPEDPTQAEPSRRTLKPKPSS
jgi:ATP-dependent helicase HrpB